jgi:hypothetical protein
LQQVVTLLQPGDVVELDGNATYPGGVTFSRDGTAAAPIIVRGLKASGKRPILAGGANTIEAAGDHYVFEGLEITGGSARCFYHHADQITLRDSVVRDCSEHGVLGADEDSGSLYLEHCEVYRCGNGTQRHQIYIATDESAHPGSVFRMDHCFVHDATGGNNVKTRAERNEIRYNWIEGALYHELELIGPDGQDPSLAREDSDVVGNVFFKRNQFFVVRVGGDGTGETHGRYRFVNNTIIVQPGGSAVFRVFDGIEALEAHNNVFASADGGPVNMLREAEAAWSSGRVVGGSNNSVPPGSLAVPPEWVGTQVVSNPGFQNLAASDVRLVASSPLVDAGVATTSSCPGHPFPSPLARPQFVPALGGVSATDDGLERPNDGTPDIGAYEVGGSPGGTGGSGGSGGSGSAGTGGTAGSTGGTAGSTGGTAGSTGGTAGSTGGTAGSTGGTSGSTGGTSGSTGGTSGSTGGTAGSTGGSGGGTAGPSAGGGSTGSLGAPPEQDNGAGSTGTAHGGSGGTGSDEASGRGSKSDGTGEADAPAPEAVFDDEGGVTCSVGTGSGSPGGVALTLLGAIAALITRWRRRG